MDQQTCRYKRKYLVNHASFPISRSKQLRIMYMRPRKEVPWMVWMMTLEASHSLPTAAISLHIKTSIINENYHTIFALIFTQADYPNAMRGMLANMLEGNTACHGRCGLLTLAFAVTKNNVCIT